MVAAGVSLIRALNIVTEQIGERETAQGGAVPAWQQVEGGLVVLRSHGRRIPTILFPPIMANMVRAGETGGFLDEVAAHRGGQLRSGRATRKGRSKAHMAYPVVVLGIAAAAWWCVMLLTIVPMFASMYASMGAELPWVDADPGGPGQSAAPYVPFPVLIVCRRWRWPCSGSATATKTLSPHLVGSVHAEGAGVRQAGHQRGPGALLQQFRFHARFGRADSAGA